MTLASVSSCRCRVTLPSLRSMSRHGAASSSAIAPFAMARFSSNSQDVERNAGQRVTPLPTSKLYPGASSTGDASGEMSSGSIRSASPNTRPSSA